MVSSGSLFAAEPDEWDRWVVHNPAEKHVPDHKYLTTFLKAYGRAERGQTAFAYTMMKGQGIKYLEAYSNYLESIPVSKLNRDEQLTYWLNLYNTGAIRAVASLKRVPKRMDEHRGVPGAPGAMWSSPRFTIEGYNLSLEDIEVNILARHWTSADDNAMWIYGLTWAAKGSPSLPLMAFYGSTVHNQLNKNATGFVKRSANLRVRKNKVQLSSLYEWQRSSLGGNDASILAHLKQVSDDKTGSRLAEVTEISGYRFSWRTNSFAPAKDSRGQVEGGQDTGGMQGY